MSLFDLVDEPGRLGSPGAKSPRDATFQLSGELAGYQSSPTLSGATSVTLRGEDHAADGILLVASSWPRVTKLQLRDKQGLAWWPLTQSWTQLKQLALSGSDLGVAGAQRLRLVPLPHLMSLYLMNTRLDTAAIKQLSMATWPALEDLNLLNNKGNRFYTAAAGWFITAKWPELTSLDLSCNKLTAESIKLLTSAV